MPKTLELEDILDKYLIDELIWRIAPGLQTLLSRWVYLQAPLTSTSWDGDSHSDTVKTLIDLSSVFGVPAGVTAVYVYVAVRDSGAAANDTYMFLGPTDTADEGVPFKPLPVDDRFCACNGVIPCDSNGDIYYQIEASGAATFDAVIQVWGYCMP